MTKHCHICYSDQVDDRYNCEVCDNHYCDDCSATFNEHSQIDYNCCCHCSDQSPIVCKSKGDIRDNKLKLLLK